MILKLLFLLGSGEYFLKTLIFPDSVMKILETVLWNLKVEVEASMDHSALFDCLSIKILDDWLLEYLTFSMQ